MLFHVIIFAVTFSLALSAPAPNPAPAPAPAADPKPGLTPVVYTSPVAVSYNAFSSVQTHPSAPVAIVKSAPSSVVPAVPAVYTLQAQAAPAVGMYSYAVNYPYIVV